MRLNTIYGTSKIKIQTKRQNQNLEKYRERQNQKRKNVNVLPKYKNMQRKMKEIMITCV